MMIEEDIHPLIEDGIDIFNHGVDQMFTFLQDHILNEAVIWRRFSIPGHTSSNGTGTQTAS